MTAPTFRICEECGAEFSKRPNQSQARFNLQLCCSKACANYVDPDCHICNGPHLLAHHRLARRLRAWLLKELLRNIGEPAAPVRPKIGRPGFGRSPLIITSDPLERPDDTIAE